MFNEIQNILNIDWCYYSYQINSNLHNPTKKRGQPFSKLYNIFKS